MTTDRILFYSPNGAYGFLSNFYASVIRVDLLTYPTAEHFYQASKTNISLQRAWVAKSATPAIAKARGRQVQLREGWEHCKVAVMLDVLHAKFAQNEELLRLLLLTGDAQLIENAPRDYYWGIGSKGTGRNMLGQLLMQVRQELKAK